jgi:hypothetical protein
VPDSEAVFSEAAELKECHETFRAAIDQFLKALSFLAAANAVLLVVAIEQQKALALGATAVIPLAGAVIAVYLGRQFGNAVARGAVLEFRTRGRADGFFWMHIRSATPGLAERLHSELTGGGDASDIAAPVIRPKLVRYVWWVAVFELVAMIWAVTLLDWSWG